MWNVNNLYLLIGYLETSWNSEKAMDLKIKSILKFQAKFWHFNCTILAINLQLPMKNWSKPICYLGLGPCSMYQSRSVLGMGEKRVTSSKKMGDVTHFKEGYFYVGCRFIGISYFLTNFGE